MAQFLIDTDTGQIVDATSIVALIRTGSTRLADAVAKRMADHPNETEEDALESLTANYSRAEIEEEVHDLVGYMAGDLDEHAARWELPEYIADAVRDVTGQPTTV